MTYAVTPNMRLNLPPFDDIPWDEAVNGNFETIDAFVGSVVGISGFAGIWLNATSYTTGQQVIDVTDSTFWSCNISHTSAAVPTTFAADRAAHPTYWTMTINNAQTYAEQAAASAAAAAASEAAAEAAFNAIMPDAVHDGSLYGRINGLWQRAAPLNSPVLLGDPRAPTPPSTDNDTSIATTAFVRTVVGTVPAGVYVGDAPPVGAAERSLWWDDIGGQLYLYYNDGNSLQWVAVNSATGGAATGFLPLVGGTLTGPLLLAADPTAALGAATKQYVDGKTWPYLPIGGGTVTGAVTIQGALTANSTATIAGALTTTSGRIVSRAIALPSIAVWDTDSGHAWGMWQAASGLVFGETDANGVPGAVYMSLDTTTKTLNVEGAVNGKGSVWAANLFGAFGLQDFGGGYRGLRFSSDGWRWQWNSANGRLGYYNNSNVELFSVVSNGDANVAGAVYTQNGIHFSAANSAEYAAFTDGSGNHILNYRAGYYDQWQSAGGLRSWISNNVIGMTLDVGGNLWIGASFTAAGNINATSISATLDVIANRNISVANNLSVGAGLFCVTGVLSGALYAASGTFIGGNGDSSFGMYKAGSNNVMQYAPAWVWQWDTTNGNLTWVKGGTGFFVCRATDNFVYNSIGPMGGNGAYNNFSDRTLKENIVPWTTGLSAIMALTPVQFTRTDNESGEVEAGFIAQDVQPLIPEAVRELAAASGTVLAITYDTIVTALVNAVQELTARIVALEAH